MADVCRRFSRRWGVYAQSMIILHELTRSAGRKLAQDNTMAKTELELASARIDH